MSTEQYNTTERSRSSQDKKPEWDRSLVGQPLQHAYLLQQNLQQMPHTYAHHPHQHLSAGSIEGGMFRTSGCSQPTFGNPNPTVDHVRMMQNAPCVFAGQALVHPCREDELNGASISHVQFGIPPLQVSSSNSHRSSATISARPHAQQARVGEEKAGGTKSVPMPAKSSAPRRLRNSSISPLTVRATGTKDRHSKVRTAKGLRDRRVRLSAPTAIQFFDVQDRLGYDQPSKAVDWLIKKARAAIDELAPVEGIFAGDEGADTPVHEKKLSREHDLHGSSLKVKDEDQILAGATSGGARAESRAKARERARVRAKEKTSTPPGSATSTTAPMETSSTSPPAAPIPVAQPLASPSLHLLPEFLMFSSQFRQQFDELHRPPDLSSMLTPQNSAPLPATHLLPFAPGYFPASATMFPGDGPSLEYSAQPINYNSTTAATTTNSRKSHNSPRGTLQSIFSSPATSSMQAHVTNILPPLMLMGEAEQAQAFGENTLSSIVSEGGHNNDSSYPQSSAEVRSTNFHQHSHIPMQVRGIVQLQGSRVQEESRITPSSMQAEFQ